MIPAPSASRVLQILDVHDNDAGSRHRPRLFDGQLDGTDRCGRAINGYEDLHDLSSPRSDGDWVVAYDAVVRAAMYG